MYFYSGKNLQTYLMKYVVCNDSRVDSLVAIMLNRYVKEKRRSNRIVATKIVVFPTMLRSMSRNLVSESLREFIIPVFAQCLYFKIDRCLLVMQSDRRLVPTSRAIVLQHERRFISLSTDCPLCERVSQ